MPPPDSMLDDPGDHGPRFDLDGDLHRWRLVLYMKPSGDATMLLRERRAGVDLLIRDFRGAHVSRNHDRAVNTARALRALVAGRHLLRDQGYPYLPNDDGTTFVATLCPGEYEIEHDGPYQFLWWRDAIGTEQTDTPRHEPEVQCLLPPRPAQPRKAPRLPKPKRRRPPPPAFLSAG